MIESFLQVRATEAAPTQRASPYVDLLLPTVASKKGNCLSAELSDRHGRQREGRLHGDVPTEPPVRNQIPLTDLYAASLGDVGSRNSDWLAIELSCRHRVGGIGDTGKPSDIPVAAKAGQMCPGTDSFMEPSEPINR